MVEVSMELRALADRVEALTAYDGRLMAEIDCAAFYLGEGRRPAEPGDHPNVRDRPFDPSSIRTRTGWLMSSNYFRDIDSANRLVPGNGKWSITAGHAGDWQACVWMTCGLALDWRSAATPALALTAAALRARASLLDSPHTKGATDADPS